MPMSDPSVHFAPGGYRYLPGGFQYSAAVKADSEHRLESARFERPVPMAQGFERIARHLESLGRPMTALCGCELRTAASLSEADFIAFNRGYVQPLAQWGLFRDDVNPVARCNLVPLVSPPTQPSFHGFTYTMPLAGDAPRVPDFLSSGAAECPDRPGYRDAIVRLGDTSPDALTDKLRFALGDLASRLEGMGVAWTDVTRLNLYTAHDLHHAIESEIVRLGAMGGGLTVHWVRPPIIDLEIEVDARRVSRELILSV